MIELDAYQQQAVDAGPTDVFISAGAGSGKTRVLTARFVSAVLGRAPYPVSDPTALLTITYTEKAAAELTHRIRGALTEEGRHDAARRIGDAWISTIHTMCSRILRQYAFDAGVDPGFSVADGVTASLLETRALEHAMREVIETTPDGPGLFDAYATRTVVDAARAIRASLRALGTEPGAVRTVSRAEVDAEVAGAIDTLEEIAQAAEALPSAKCTTDCATTARAAAEHIKSAQRAVDPRERAGLLLATARTGFRAEKRVAGLPELVDQAREAIDRARRCGAQLAVEGYERAFLALVASLDREYARLKRERGVLDFEDLQTFTAHLLETRPDVAAEARRRFSMIMVDEFQDTNALQLGIITHLADGNLCTVGDENQSIYSFRHADLDVFRSRFETIGSHVALRRNYRTDSALLAAVNGLMAQATLLGEGFAPLLSFEEGHNAGGGVTAADERSADPRNADGCSGGTTGVAPAAEIDILDTDGTGSGSAAQREAERISARVADLVSEGYNPGEIAVLMQRLAGGYGAAVERALQSRGIPVVLGSGGTFFESLEYGEVRSLLRTISNVFDDQALLGLLAGRLTGLGPSSLLAIRREADRRGAAGGLSRSNSHLWEALAGELPALDEPDASALARTLAVVGEARLRQGSQPLDETVLNALLALDADLVYLAAGSDGPRAWANALKVVSLARDYESATGGSLAGFIESLDQREQYGKGERDASLDDENTAVRVMSIHAAKGLEFPAVVLAGLTPGPTAASIAIARVGGEALLGMSLCGGDETHDTLGSLRVRDVQTQAREAEVRRLLYVGCTRAMRSLTIVVREDMSKVACNTPTGWIRSAVGLGDVGAAADTCEVSLGDGRVRVRVLRGGEPVWTDDGSDPECGPDPHAEAAVTPEPGQAPPPAIASGSQPSSSTIADDPQSGPRAPGTHAARGGLLVSYTTLGIYRACPLRYFLTSVVRLPLPPAARTRSQEFGTLAHAVLERCRSPHDDVPTLVEQALKASGGPADGARIESAVRRFLESELATEALSAPRVMHEAPMALSIGGATLVGALDLYSREGSNALIVDFKTGAGPLDEATARNRYQLQSECYALAALQDGATSVRVVFSEIERNREIAFAYSPEDRVVLEEDLGGTIGRIAEARFEPLAEYAEGLCDSCPGFGGVCSVRRPEHGSAG